MSRIVVIGCAAMMTMAGCGDVNSALEHVADARRLAADLHAQFARASDAGNRAVMADTDDASAGFARESEQAAQRVDADIAALRPVLQGLAYTEEALLLEQFTGLFTQYRELERQILDLAVQNTNVKARQLSFGSAQEAADRFRDALLAIVAAAPADNKWHVEALASTAIAALREIQALQAPHIADATDVVMERVEQRMAAAGATARRSLTGLAPLVAPSARAALTSATTTLDQFIAINAEITALSRRNTNVHSLALALDQKQKLTTPCEEKLRALLEALDKRGYAGVRRRLPGT